MPDFLSAVQRHACPGQFAGLIEIPGRDEKTSEWPRWVPPRLLAALRARGIERLWTHQAEAARLIHSGVHTVVATGTGSGKSLAAWLPGLSLLSGNGRDRADTGTASRTLAGRVAADSSPDEAANANVQLVPARRKRRTRDLPGGSGLRSLRYRPTVLYLAPTKALAADQFSSLTELAHDVNPRLGVAVVDGDSEDATRAWAREHASLVLSNPDFVHHVMLASHRRWAHLWRGLAMVVIDEFHSYRGLFGAHVASTVRRLLRVAAHYGARPTVVFLSATSGDPAGTAQRFLGNAFGEVRAVDDDGSPTGPRKVVLWRCREQEESRGKRAQRLGAPDPDTDLPSPDAPRRAANTEAGELTGVLTAEGAQTLTFVRSRPGAERIAEIARGWLSKHRPELEDAVAAYRGGYLPEERRSLERALHSGQIRALASTNALELGIDVAGLDAVVVTGWPGTHASFAQQIGRAGRAGREGLAVFVGRDDPLDQYLLSHPEVLASAPMETNVFDPGNHHALVPHLCAAASELPLTEADAEVFGLPDTSLFDFLVSDTMLRKRPTGWFWNQSLTVGPHVAINLRDEENTVTIVEGESGAILGTVDSSRADTTVFPGAVYLHQGVPYHVESLTELLAIVRPYHENELRTYAHEETSVEIVSTDESFDLGIGVWARGDVSVTSQVVGYDARRANDGMYLGRVPLAMPVRKMITHGTWWTMNARAIQDSTVDPGTLAGALHAAEHTAIGILPLLATCDRWDLGGLSTAFHADTGQATVIVHDAVRGGSGCSQRGFEHGREWIRATLDALASCPCSSGCPRCVQSPKCGNNNEPLSKEGAMHLLATLAAAMERNPNL